MLMKRIGAVVLCAALLLVSAGCGSVTDLVESVGDNVSKVVNGVVPGQVGTTHRTQWFDFTVLTARTVTEYAGYTPYDDYILVDVVVRETSTFGDTIPLGTFDFYIMDESGEHFALPSDAQDDTMMPSIFYLEKGESAEYHMVFNVPADAEGLVLVYTEVDEEESEGITYLVDLDLP